MRSIHAISVLVVLALFGVSFFFFCCKLCTWNERIVKWNGILFYRKIKNHNECVTQRVGNTNFTIVACSLSVFIVLGAWHLIFFFSQLFAYRLEMGFVWVSSVQWCSKQLLCRKHGIFRYSFFGNQACGISFIYSFLVYQDGNFSLLVFFFKLM